MGPSKRRLLNQSTPVAVVNQPIAHLTSVQCLLECIQHQIRLHGSTHSPAHDTSSEHVHDEGHLHEARPRGDVRGVKYA
jgi:hypothetical protein